MENYIECPLDEATHALIASKHRVPIQRGDGWWGEWGDTKIWTMHFKDFGITPIKLAPPKKPKQHQCETQVSVTMPTFHDPRVTVDLPKEWQEGTKVLVTVTEQEPRP